MGHGAPKWDAIVIGSGTGGLTTAAYLSANGLRTLVLEAQPVVGGAAQEFQRGKVFSFSTGAHYIGDCELDGVIPTVLRGVGLEDEIKYNNMDPDGFDRLIAPGLDLRVPRGWRQFEIRLTRMFPKDATGIRRTLKTLRKAAEALEKLGAPPIPSPLELMRHPNTLLPVMKSAITLEQLFDLHRLSESARTALGYICAFLLLPRTKIPATMYAFALNHYIKSGGWYVRGGVARIPRTLARVIRCNDGEVRLHTKVDKILIEHGRANGVRLETGEEIYSPIVVSNADIKTTYASLIDAVHTKACTRRRIAKAPLTPTLFSVYLGLNIDVRQHMSSEHRFYLSSLNFNELTGSHNILSASWTQYEEMDEYALWITSPTLKDTPKPGSEGFSSIEITTSTPQSYDFWGVQGGALDGIDYHSDPEYIARKSALEHRVIERVKQLMPFIDGHIVWQESSTMLSHEDWTRTRLGAWAGLDFSLKNIVFRPGPRTEIDGLYLTGASSRCGGAMLGTLRGGLDTATAILQRNLWKEVKSGKVFGSGLTDKTFRNTDQPTPGFHQLLITSIERDTPDSVIIEMQVPDALRDEYRFTAGQYVIIRGEAAGEPIRRSYSICEPAETRRLRIGVKHAAGGVFSPYALTLKPGDTLDTSTPRGQFVHVPDPTNSGRYVFIAAGSGITPVISLISTILNNEPGSETVLLYGNRTRQDIMFADEIAELAVRFGSRISVTHYLSRESESTQVFRQGRIDSQALGARLSDDIHAPDVNAWFLCGPQPMVHDAIATLDKHGVKPAAVHVELFDTKSTGTSVTGRPGPAAQVTLHTDSGSSTLSIPRNTDTVLEYAIQRTDSLPYSCQSGSCGTCIAKVCVGQAEMEDIADMPLTDGQIADGYILACLARPISDELTLDFRSC
ncbi:FAD-dependent oxidoreductase [Mycobacterium sp. D16R24]|uniref:FAD-dependent oxidoreductase n=1 Tax=Mycobacterium sp. D16R24 TaxID=1855656 RepID=UPI000993382D|nr:FAD-dependent oxidoreductase [Mycobacterium sp. D16R24]